MPVLPPNAIQGADADAAQVAAVVDPQALGASQALPPPVSAVPPLPIDALMAAASGAPPAAADPFAGDAVDQAIAPALPPAGGPALSLVPPPPPAEAGPTGSPVDVAAGLVKDQTAVNAETVANATEKARLDKEAADEKARVAAEKEKALQALQARQELHMHAAEAEVAAARAKAESEPYHTFWETRSIGQNIATGIGLILGGVSWNPAHVNRGVDLVNKMIEQDLALQKEKHADLWRAVNEAQEGIKALDVNQLRELSAFAAAEGAKNDAVGSRLSAAAAMNKGKGDITTAKQEGIKKSEEANRLYALSAQAAATANHLDEVAKENARHHAEQEKTAALRAAKYKTKGGATGSGGAREQAAITLTQEIQDAKAAGKPMSMADIDRRAVALKIPLIGKANQITARTIAADAAKEAKTEAAATKQEIQLTEKDEARTLRDPKTDQPFRLMPTARNVKDAAKDLSAIYAYQEKVEKLAAHIEKYGQIVDDPLHPLTKLGNERMSYLADVQAQGRQLSGIQASDTGTKLEGQMIGHSGVGLRAALNLQSMADPKVLRELMETGVNMTRNRIIAGSAPISARGASKGGASDDRMLEAAKNIVSGKSPASEAAKKKAQDYLNAHGDIKL